MLEQRLAVLIVACTALVFWGVPVALGLALGGATLTIYDFTAAGTIFSVLGLVVYAEKRERERRT